MTAPIRPESSGSLYGQYLRTKQQGGGASGTSLYDQYRKQKSDTGNIDLRKDIGDLRNQIESTSVARKAPPQSGPSTTESSMMGGASGASFSFADELAGAMGALAQGSSYTGGLSKAAQNYHASRDDYRTHEQAAQAAHPKAYLASQLAGGLVPIIATGGAGGSGKLGSAVLQGAGYGAAQGIGTAKELSDIPSEALYSGALGGIGGGAIHGAMAGGGALARALGIPEAISKGATWAAVALPSRTPFRGQLSSLLETAGASTGSAGAANRAINKRVANSGTTPEALTDRIRQTVAQSGEKPEILADYSPEVRGLTKAVTKKPGTGRAQILDAIQNRNTGTRDRVLADLGGGTAPADVRPRLEGMIRDRSASAAQLFPKAGSQVIDDPAVTEILSRPTFKELYADAQRLAADEGRSLPTTTTHEMAPEAQALLDGAQPADQPKLLQQLISSGAAVPKEVPRPDVETIGYIERALKDRIDKGFNGSSTTGKSQAAVLQQGFRDLRDRVAQLSPEYDAAITDFAARSKPIEAGNLGLNLNKYTGPLSKGVPRQAMGAGDPLALKATRTGVSGLEQAVSNLDPSAQDMFRRGGLTNLTDAAARVPETLDGSTNGVLRSVFKNSPEQQRVRSLLFDSPDTFGTFQSALGRERGMAATSAKLGGSDTAENLAEAKSIESPSILRAIMKPAQTLRGMVDTQSDARDQAVYGALGSRLGASGSQDMQSVLAELLRARVGEQTINQSGNILRNALIPQVPFVGAPQ